jgi:hypothetical protein
MAKVLNIDVGSALAGYLSAAVRQRFAWGRHDCMLFAAGWAQCLTGQDPAAAWRGRYTSKDGAALMVAEAGSTGALMRSALARCGWVSVLEPVAGDIGLVLATAPTMLPTAAICVDGASDDSAAAWAMATARGVVIAPAEALQVWRRG